MSDEIKEILEDIKYLVEKNEYSGGTLMLNELKLLLDYITNLQEEKEDYKSRCEKAVEYIKNNCEYINKGYIDEKMIIGDWFELKDLLNTLTGGDKE